MIAPDFRQYSPSDLAGATKTYIETQHGNDLWKALENSITELDASKKELSKAIMYKSEHEQLLKLKDLFAKDYCNSMLLNKYFSFGPGAMQIKHTFTWHDSFTR